MFEYLQKRPVGLIDHYREFSVMIPLVEKDGDYQVLFEVRSSDLDKQPGEICFPGGSREEHESAEENAVRETMEELRIKPEQIHVIAQLDSLITPSDNKVDVFLCELKYYQMTFSEDEVAEVFLVPLSFFLENEPASSSYSLPVVPDAQFPYQDIPGTQRGEMCISTITMAGLSGASVRTSCGTARF